jgi:hypothetical protein
MTDYNKTVEMKPVMKVNGSEVNMGFEASKLSSK